MSRKKVIIRRFNAGLVSGYLTADGFVHHDALELLDLSGRVLRLPLTEIKLVSFVRDFNPADQVNPERMLRKTFPARPRTEGLWLRLTLRDDDVMEGLAALDLSLVDGIAIDQGIQMTPPDVRGNVQRLYVPRAAILSLQILAVVTTPSRKKAASRTEEPEEDLFSNITSTRLQ